MYVIDREVEYKDVFFRIIEVLGSDTLLVVKKEDYDKGKFPLLTYVIPGE